MALVCAFAVILGGCGKAPTAPTQKAEPTEQTEQTEAAPQTEQTEPADPVLVCYQELLKAAPAIEGEHPQLQDAAFGDEQNREMFGDHYDRFAVIDINQDGTPELMASTVINFRWVPVSVFTYADRKAVLLKDPTEESVNGTFEQNSSASGAYTTYLCAENHIHSVWSGDTPVGQVEENHAFVLEGTTLTPVDCTAPAIVSFADIAADNTAQNADAMISK